MDIRHNIEQEALSLFKSNKALALLLATGVGKSKIAIKLHEDLIRSNKGKNLKVLLLIAEKAHKENWKIEYKKWGFPLINYDTIVVECYQSLKKYEDTEWDLIIFDEAHHLSSTLRFGIFSTLKAAKYLFLSATLPERLLVDIELILKCKLPRLSLSLKQAIEKGVIPTPKVYIVPLELDNTHKNCTITEEWGKKESQIQIKCDYYKRWEYLKNKKQYPNVSLTMESTELTKYQYLTEKYSYWKNRYFATRNEALKFKWLQFGIQRKRFLGDIKTKYIKYLLEKLGDKRYICFCSSIEQANELNSETSIHSEKSNSLELISKFNNKEIDTLFAVGMTREGQNLVDLHSCIIAQLDGQELQFIQKFGRGVRAKEPILFIFYYKETRDQEYLDKIIPNIDPNHINYVGDLINFEL